MLQVALGLILLLAAPLNSTVAIPVRLSSDVAPSVDTHGYFDRGNLVVPVRPLVQVLGGYADYARPVVHAVVRNRAITLELGSTTASERTGKPLRLPVAPRIRNAVMYVPLRILMEYFGASVQAKTSNPAVVFAGFTRSSTLTGQASPSVTPTISLSTKTTIAITAPPLTAPPLTAPPLTQPPMTPPPITAPTPTLVQSAGVVNSPNPTIAPPVTALTVNAAARAHDDIAAADDSKFCPHGYITSPSCHREVAATMLDFVALVLVFVIAVIVVIPNTTHMLRWRLLIGASIAIGLLFVEEVIALASRSTLTSFVFVAPFFLKTFYSAIVLFTVLAVVGLGVWQSFLQFKSWSDQKAKLVEGMESQFGLYSLILSRLNGLESELKATDDKISVPPSELKRTGLEQVVEALNLDVTPKTEAIRRINDVLTSSMAIEEKLFIAEDTRQQLLIDVHDLEQRYRDARAVSSRTNADDTQTKLELSIARGVTITTPVIGLATLTLSLAFLYLFLVYGEPAVPK